MTGKNSAPGAHEPSLAEQAAPRPAPPTPEDRDRVAQAQKRAKDDQDELRAKGFGDHKGTEGF